MSKDHRPGALINRFKIAKGVTSGTKARSLPRAKISQKASFWSYGESKLKIQSDLNVNNDHQKKLVSKIPEPGPIAFGNIPNIDMNMQTLTASESLQDYVNNQDAGNAVMSGLSFWDQSKVNS